MFKELDTVVLTHNIKEHGLEKGDIGAVIHLYSEGKALEVEFVKADGGSIATLTLEPKDVRNITRSEILKVREFATT